MKKCIRCNNSKDIFEFSKIKSGTRNVCKLCINKSRRERRSKNIEQYRNYDKKYRTENKDKINSNRMVFYYDNQESEIEKKKIYYSEHKNERSEYRKRYKDTENGRMIIRLNNLKRKLNIKDVCDGSIIESSIFNLLETQNHKCTACNSNLFDFHIDHKVPLSRGGYHTITNIQILCPKCNLTKHTKTDEEFRLIPVVVNH